MRKRNLFFLLSSICLVLVFVALPIIGCTTPSTTPTTPPPTTTPTAEAKTLKVGALVCLTGWFSTYDALEYEELQIGRDMINDSGGITINGQKYLIELIAEDCKSTLDGVGAAANKLVYEDKVSFIAGPGAYFAPAAKDVCETNKVLRVIPWCTNQPGELDKTTQYTFLCHNASVEMAVVGCNYLNQAYPNVKSLDFVMPDDGSQPYLEPIVRKLITDSGHTVVGDVIAYPNEMVDFSPIATKLVASKSDAVFHLSGIPQGSSGILKAMRALGSDKPFAACQTASIYDILSLAGESASTNFFDVSITYDMPDTPPMMAEIQKRLLAKYGKDRSLVIQMVSGLLQLKQVIEKAQSLDTTVVRDTYENMDNIETPYGNAQLGGLVTYGIKHAVNHPSPVGILDKGQPKFGAWVPVSDP